MRGAVVLGSLTVLAAFVVSVALAAGGPPPPPHAVNGHAVAVVARGIPTPTTFAWGAGHLFVAAFGSEEKPMVPGGVYTVAGERATKLPGSPPHVFGLAWHAPTGTLFLSTGPQILAWSGWNGRRFTHSRVVVTAPDHSAGFNGIALGPAENLYAGMSLGDRRQDDYSRGTKPWANDVVTVNAVTGEIAFHATGMRQPWQPVFVPGHRGPLISDLGQENLGQKRPVDRIVEIQPGADYGFPSCPAKPATCARYTRPFATFPAHSSPMGLAALGGRLYIALFGGTGRGPEVVSMPLGGGAFRPVLAGFVAPVVALGEHGGRIYVGDLTGTVYSFVPLILVVDNYDSFTYNLVHLFAELGAEVEVRRNDAVDADEALRLAPTHLVVSPGPGRPAEAGATIEVIRALAGRVPVLGVCLGHQAIVEAFGGVVGPAHELVHGKAAPVRHDGQGIFAGLPDPFEAGRYHSLAATTVPDVLEVSATAPDGEVMAVRHRELPVDGVQFHPESVLTPEGRAIAANFLR